MVTDSDKSVKKLKEALLSQLAQCVVNSNCESVISSSLPVGSVQGLVSHRHTINVWSAIDIQSMCGRQSYTYNQCVVVSHRHTIKVWSSIIDIQSMCGQS